MPDKPVYSTTQKSAMPDPDSAWIPASEREAFSPLPPVNAIGERIRSLKASHAVADSLIAELVAALRCHVPGCLCADITLSRASRLLEGRGHAG